MLAKPGPWNRSAGRLAKYAGRPQIRIRRRVRQVPRDDVRVTLACDCCGADYVVTARDRIPSGSSQGICICPQCGCPSMAMPDRCFETSAAGR